VPTDSPPRSAYVHVPFCRHRCGYCDFTLVARRDDLIPEYLAALGIELRELGEPWPVDTLFLGGGTPTHLPPDDLERLFQLLVRWLPLRAGGEFSVEANPSGLDDPRIDILHAAGVNRVSLGAQSFDPRHLQTLERDHSPEQIAEVVARLRPRVPNLALDLIFAVPGQTVDDWALTLDEALRLSPRHLSTYGLTWERGTAYWSRKLKGALLPVDEETERSMYELALDRLPEAGFAQYELSNFALPGWESRHNQVYWQGDSYRGFGPGAASYVGGVRWTNHRSVTTWIRRLQAGQSPVQDREELSPIDRAREAIMLGLRQRAGIDLAEFVARHAVAPRDLEPAAYDRRLAAGLLELVAGRLRLTRAGCFVADSVMSDFL